MERSVEGAGEFAALIDRRLPSLIPSGKITMYQMPLTSSRPATLCCLAFVLACAVTPAFAQTGSATVQGAVTDPTGAVVPGADVTLTEN
jgi:hypothetical protein